MKMKRVSLGMAVGLTLVTPLAAAAVTTLSGGITTRYQYLDRQSKDTGASDNAGYSKVKIMPLVKINSETSRQFFECSYEPSFWHDLDSGEDEVDQDLFLDYLGKLTQHWNVYLKDYLTVTEDYNNFGTTIDPATGDIISENPGASGSGDIVRDNRGKRRFQLNSLRSGTAYTYLEDSVVGFDYIWTSLRIDSEFSGTNYQDYDKHDFGLTLSRRFNSYWKATAIAGYVLGLYDSVGNGSDATIPAQSDDVDQYRASMLVEHALSPLHTLSGYYGYSASDYESDLRSDNEIHDITLSWAWLASPKLNLKLGAGPTYTKSEGSRGRWGTNGNFDLNYRLNHGRIEVMALHGVRAEDFTGTDERGYAEYWTVTNNLEYEILEHTEVSAYANYSKEDRHETTSTDAPTVQRVRKEVYALGCSLNYRFRKDYLAALSYGFTRVDENADEDDYDDHRIMVSISYKSDFFQW